MMMERIASLPSRLNGYRDSAAADRRTIGFSVQQHIDSRATDNAVHRILPAGKRGPENAVPRPPG